MESLIHSSIPDDSPSSNRSPGSTRAAIVYEFDEFRLDPLNRLLTRAGKEFPLPGRAFDVLLIAMGCDLVNIHGRDEITIITSERPIYDVCRGNKDFPVAVNLNEQDFPRGSLG